MYSTDEFASLENMCRELATLAKKEMDYLLTEYWLAEAEEWKQLKDSAPFIEKNCEARSRHGDSGGGVAVVAESTSCPRAY